MKTRFINFEGLHGCGKSTSAWLLNEKLKNNGIKTKLFLEVDLDQAQKCPCDTRFCAVFNEQEYKEFIDKHPDNVELIAELTERYCEHYLVYYGDIQDKELVQKLKDYEAYNGRLDSKLFIDIMIQRFKEFVDKALQDDYVYIFESVLFQHILNEILRFSDLSQEIICKCISEIADILKPLNPVFYYLHTHNLEDTIEIVANQRLSDNYDLYPDWIDWMIEYIKDSRYGNSNNVQNRNDLMVYFNYRSNIEESIFNLLDIEKCRIDINSVSKTELNKIIYNRINSDL